MSRVRSFHSYRFVLGLSGLRSGAFSLLLALPALTALSGPAPAMDASLPSHSEEPMTAQPTATRPEKVNLPVQTFLDRLMMAESGGRLDAKNPRSTALGPFQFIESTFLEVARRHLLDEIAGLTDAQVLAKRMDPDFSRRAALAYTRDNAGFLDGQGLAVTSVNLRLAFLIGPTGATRLLQADGDTPVAAILSSEVLAANPFMTTMTAADLLRKAALDLSGDGRITGLGQTGSRRAIVIRCKLGLASCRRWVALRKAKLARSARRETAEE